MSLHLVHEHDDLQLDSYACDRPADLIADRLDIAALTARAVSMRGSGHLRDGLPRQDSLALTTARGWLLAVIADGIGSKPLSQHGAVAATSAVARAVAAGTAVDDPAGLVEAALDAITGLARSMGANPDDFSTTLTIAVLPVDADLDDGARVGIVHQVGDSPVLLHTGGLWEQLTPDDVDSASNVVQAWLPGRPDVSTLTVTVPASAVLLSCSDGLSIPMGRHGNGELGTALATRWGAGPRELVQFLIDMSFTGYGDDRTAIAVWTSAATTSPPADEAQADPESTD